MNAYRLLYRRPFDWLRRLWFGASVKNENIRQCPRCAGSDRIDRAEEGWGITKYHCARCDREWWS